MTEKLFKEWLLKIYKQNRKILLFVDNYAGHSTCQNYFKSILKLIKHSFVKIKESFLLKMALLSFMMNFFIWFFIWFFIGFFLIYCIFFNLLDFFFIGFFIGFFIVGFFYCIFFFFNKKNDRFRFFFIYKKKTFDFDFY